MEDLPRRLARWLAGWLDDLPTFRGVLDAVIGSDADSILWWQMSIRAVLIFLATLGLIRMGGTRVFGKNTAFDIVLGVILGSILSRALTANAAFFPTLAAAVTLVLLHMVLARLALRSHRVGHLVKGVEHRIIADGEVRWDVLRKNHMTRHDLEEILRLNAGTEEVDRIAEAYLERNGDVSVIKKSS